MAVQYSNRQFFRKTPILYLAKFFEAKDIHFNIDELKENALDILQDALDKLPLEQIINIETELRNINALACDGGIITLIDEANAHNDDAFVKEIATIEGFHAKSMWAFLNKPHYWRGAMVFLHADNISALSWKKRNDLLNLPPHLEGYDIDALAKAISAYFSSREGRGKNCIIETYRRNQKVYFFAYPEDFAQTTIEWVGEKLKNQAHRPAFEIIFVYSEVEGSLDIYAPKNGKAISTLQKLFAQHILKLDSLSEIQKDERIYDLNCILESGFDFKIDPTTGITRVLVTSLRVTLKADQKKRIVVEGDPYHNEGVVYNLLKQLNLPPYDVTQLSLKIIFEPINGARAKSRRVNITYPNLCALNYDGNDLKIRKMLAQSGLEPKAVIT